MNKRQTAYLNFMGVKHEPTDVFGEVLLAWSKSVPFGPIRLFLSIPVSWIIRLTVKKEEA